MTTALRIDRNVLTRVLGLLDGHVPTEQHRLAAGLMAFTGCADIDVEPDMAPYELAYSQGQAAALDEVRKFRIADHVHPGWWAEIALGREDRAGELPDRITLGRHDAVVDFVMSLRRWRRNYVLCLKIAELELRGGNAVARLWEFLRWSYKDFILEGTAIALAAHLFAPNATRSRLLKGLQSERAAAPTMRHCATFCALWGTVEGARLAAEVLELYGSRDAPHRRINSETGTLDDLIADGEQAIQSWRP
jgi:hypothetical protein